MASSHPRPPTRGQFTVPNAPTPLPVARDPGPADTRPLLPKPDCSTYRFTISSANHADAVKIAQSRALRYWGDTPFEILEFGSLDDLAENTQNGVVNVLSYTTDVVTRVIS